MRKIFLVPIEPIEERYSVQWLDWFKKEFKQNKIPFEIIEGIPITDNKIETGQFLDVFGTNHYKATQLASLCKLIQKKSIADDDVILFMDYWFPGVEMLQYMRLCANLNFYIAGMLHAGTWDHNDFLYQKGLEPYFKRIERSWFEIADILFVATEYHKNLISITFNNSNISNKIQVTGFPIYDELSYIKNENRFLERSTDIVFPHRLAPEKQPEKFDFLVKAFANKKYVKTMDATSDKDGYYNILASSKIAVSFALQETWGIAMQEAVILGCIPIVPNRLAYAEMYPEIFKIYGSEDLNVINTNEKIRAIFKHPLPYLKALQILKTKFLLKGKMAIPNILSKCMELE